MDHVMLERLPASADVYGLGLTGALGLARRTRGPIAADLVSLPNVQLSYRPRKADPNRLASYNELIGSAGMPPMFLHVMATPIIAALLVRPDFPVPIASTVHLASTIHQHREIDSLERLDFTVSAAKLRAHAVGVSFDITATARSNGEEVWTEVGHYVSTAVEINDSGQHSLHQFHGKVGEVLAQTDTLPVLAVNPAETWKLPADEGRKYANVSHDRSKIHTSSLAAKGFGFARAIAHGPYTAARALALLPEVKAPLHWEARFDKPVLLPATVDVSLWHTDSACGYRGSDAKTGATVFAGTVTS